MNAALREERTIYKVKPSQLERLHPLCLSFSGESKHLKYNYDAFKQYWTQILNAGLGVIFMLDGDIGMIGGVKFVSPVSGDMIASEFFWYVHPEHRGEGIRLLKRFELWAKSEGCKKVVMINLSDSQPESLQRVYRRFGYEHLETHWIKEL